MQDLKALSSSSLFNGFSNPELEQIFPLLQTFEHTYKKDDVVLMAGYATSEIGIVLSGQLEGTKYSSKGNPFLVQTFACGDLFADVLSGSHTKSPVTITALQDSAVLYLPFPALFTPWGQHAPLQHRLLANLVGTISDKYFVLNSRLDLLLIHGLRRRLASYLLAQAQQAESLTFTIPFSRAALASYLGCDRAALSREISNLSHIGLIESYRSSFKILDAEALAQLQ